MIGAGRGGASSSQPRAMPSSSERCSWATRVFRLPFPRSLSCAHGGADGNTQRFERDTLYSNDDSDVDIAIATDDDAIDDDNNTIVNSAPGMLPKRKAAGATCTSAGRVTAQLLLSFLALSSTPLAAAAAGGARADAQLVLPIEAAPIAPLIPEPPAPAVHIFVSSSSSQLMMVVIRAPVSKTLLTMDAPDDRHSGTFTTTAPTGTQASIGDKASFDRTPTYGSRPRTTTPQNGSGRFKHEAAPSRYSGWWIGDRAW